MYENDKVPEGDNEKTIKLHRIINQIYSKLHDWKDNEDSIKSFMLSAFINILGLKDDNEGIRERDRFVREIFALAQIDGKPYQSGAMLRVCLRTSSKDVS